MSSPFPGMNPYIESCGLWGDFHQRLITSIADQLAEAAPERYFARTQERSYLVLVESEGKQDYAFYPDVSVTTPERPRKSAGRKGTATKVAASRQARTAKPAEPLTLRAFIEEEHREAFVEIYEATPQQRLVTIIEVLSPSNKQRDTAGWELYLRKRQSALLGGVHFVEIDLLQGGDRMPMLDPWPGSPYYLMVARAKKAQLCRVWPADYKTPLPPVPVPLLKPDPDLTLDLQPLIDGIYRRSRYAQSIDYSRPPTPPLGPEDTAWLLEQLRQRKP